MTTIVCGTDFSASAAQAADAAAGLAARLDAPLDLVHVADGFWMELSQRARAVAVAEIGDRLRTEADRLRAHGAHVREHLLYGAAPEMLVAHARAAGAALLVVASLGRRAAARWLVGSVAERTVQSAGVPVLVVRAAAPFLAWVGGDRALRVTVAADFSTSADAALGWVATLRAVGPCDVTVVYASRPPADRRRLGVGVRSTLVGNDPDVDAVLRQDLRRKIERGAGNGQARVRVEACLGRVSTHVVNLAVQDGADLLVVGTRQRQGPNLPWHGSVSRGVLHAAPMSVACVPATRPTAHEPPRLPEVRTVLAATDLSELGDRAVPFAFGLLPRGGTVHVMHVVEMADVADLCYRHYVTGFPPTDAQRAAQEPELAAHLQALIPVDAADKGVQSEIHILEAQSAAAAIASAAERLGADLICVGSHGRSGLSAAFAGSAAQDLIAHSGRPVVVVGPGPA